MQGTEKKEESYHKLEPANCVSCVVLRSLAKCAISRIAITH